MKDNEFMKHSWIKKTISNADVVSFDIYDTLIGRKVTCPADVFSLIEIKYNSLHSGKIRNFKKRRIEEEQNCRKSCRKEITLSQIYHRLKRYYGKATEELEELETELEHILSYRKADVYSIYRYAKLKKKKVLLISDIYLPEIQIKSILKKNGIDGYDGLYVSSETGYQKRSGKLYNYIRNKEYMDSNLKWVHFGDNLKSDYLQAKKHGISAYFIKKNHAEINNTFIFRQPYTNPYKNFGYNVLGPLMLGYVLWLKKNFDDYNITHVFFFSREGYFIKKCFELFYGKNTIKTSYLYVSRKSLLIPVLTEPDIFNRLEQFRTIGNKSSYEYLQSLGLSKKNTEKFLIKYGIKGSDAASAVLKNKRALYSILQKENKGKSEMLSQYLAQEGVNGKFAVVDAGWTGTMQIGLEKNLKANHVPFDLYGFFIGQRPEMKNYLKYQIKNEGWLCNYNGPKDRQNILLSGNCLFELLMMAPHGTVTGYKRTNKNSVEPVLEDNEYRNDYETILCIQNYAEKFLDDYKKLFGEHMIYGCEEYFKGFRNFLCNPDKKLAEAFGDITFYDSGKRKIAPYTKKKNLSAFIRGYVSAYWKTGYLKRNLSFPMPYITVYKMTRYLGKMIRG